MSNNNNNIYNKLSEIQVQLVVLTDLLKELVKKPKHESSSTKKSTQGITMIPYPIQSITPGEKSPIQSKHKSKVTKAVKVVKASPRCTSKEVPKILNDIFGLQSTKHSSNLDHTSVSTAAEPISTAVSSVPPVPHAAPSTPAKRLRLEGLNVKKNFGGLKRIR